MANQSEYMTGYNNGYADAEKAARERQLKAIPIAEVVSAYGDPEAFGEREIRTLADLSKVPYGTKLYAK